MDDQGVTTQGLEAFIGEYIGEHCTAFHEEYQGRQDSMHYVDFAFPADREKLRSWDGEKWVLKVRDWELRGEIRYFEARRRAVQTLSAEVFSCQEGYKNERG